MKSFINSTNASKIPYSLILFFLFLYVCPNIKYFGVGEMSYLPGLIILFAYSLLNRGEFFKYLNFLFICIIWPLLIYFSNRVVDYSLMTPLISFYIIVIPVLSSILLGRLIGYRFFENEKKVNQNEFKKTIIFLILGLFLSELLNKINPSILGSIIYTGRTSFGRWTFFFTEPSQSSSVLLILWLLTLLILFKKDIYYFFGKQKFLFFLLIPSITILFSYLSLPMTLLAQIFILFVLISIAFFTIFFKNALNFANIKLRILGTGKINKHTFYSLILLLISFLMVCLLAISSPLLSYRFGKYILGAENVIMSIFFLGGFRFYYSFAAIISSLENPLKLPGSWSGNFALDMLDILEKYKLIVSDEILQLSKSFSVIKPLGWFYFSIYDLGIIGLIIFCFFFLKPFIFYVTKGIINCDFLAITLFSAQIALLVVPLLPSTPSVFFPLLIISSINSYNYKVKLNNSNKNIIIN